MKKHTIKFIHVVTGITACISAILLTFVFFYSTQIPSKFYVTEGSEFELKNTSVLSSGNILNYEKTSLANKAKGASQTVQINFLGVVPVKATHVSVISEQEVTPGGTAFGIKLFTKGVIVVDINNVETSSGIACPAKLAGIQKGDVVTSIKGVNVSSNEEIEKIISSSNGASLQVTLMRDEKKIKTMLTPALSSIDGTYKCGLWVRDSSAGIGTVTYFKKDTGAFAGLGHGICDSDTGKIMPLSSGEVCSVQINSVLKGQVGTPGELRGCFTSNEASGQLILNNEAGIFGYLSDNPNDFNDVEVGLKQEVKPGKATILCTLSAEGPKEYEINIDRIDLNPKTLTKNMVISVTDPQLLEKTGGIVQGMSGSPILQNGKLIGAVTHVFVNNPQKGYAIFAENMMNFTNTIANAS